MPTALKSIHPNNSYLVRQYIERWDAATNAYVKWTGASTIVCGFYEDALGVTPIAGLTNIAMTESSVGSGVYYAIVLGTMTAPLSTMTGDTIFQIVTGGTNSDLRVVVPLLVANPRYALLGD